MSTTQITYHKKTFFRSSPYSAQFKLYDSSKIFFSSGAVPYITLKLQSKKDSDILGEVMKILKILKMFQFIFLHQEMCALKMGKLCCII